MGCVVASEVSHYSAPRFGVSRRVAILTKWVVASCRRRCVAYTQRSSSLQAKTLDSVAVEWVAVELQTMERTSRKAEETSEHLVYPTVLSSPKGQELRGPVALRLLKVMCRARRLLGFMGMLRQ